MSGWAGSSENLFLVGGGAFTVFSGGGRAEGAPWGVSVIRTGTLFMGSPLMTSPLTIPPTPVPVTPSLRCNDFYM